MSDLLRIVENHGADILDRSFGCLRNHDLLAFSRAMGAR
jgi:hypothetical protein